jgi:hypothetical protein
MESITPGTWPWITLVAVATAFVLGMLFGRPRFLASWGGTERCSQRCDCTGAVCDKTAPHVHCPTHTVRGCPNSATCDLDKGHTGPHHCPDGHAF